MDSLNKVILVTGASSGFGMLSALTLAEHHRVYATVRSLDKAKDLQEAFQKLGRSLSICEMDVTKLDSISRVLAQIETEQGRLDVLINNAGYALAGFFEDLSEDEIREQFESNFFGLQSVTRLALPLLRRSSGPQSEGRIINISSIAGLTGTPFLGAYNASKWAVEGFSESLYFELLPFHIRVLLIEPGAYKTKIFNQNVRVAKGSESESSVYLAMTEHISHLIQTKVRPRLGNPDRVASFIAHCAIKKNPRFRYILGGDARLRLWAKRLLPFSIYSRLIRFALSI